MSCELCAGAGGVPLWQDGRCRAISVDEPDYPGFCRVVWRAHVKEMTDLDAEERGHLMQVVFAVESALRDLLDPDKINLASFGNSVPHLHWHVIPRFIDDPHFPQAVWSNRRREPDPARRALPLEQLIAALGARLG